MKLSKYKLPSYEGVTKGSQVYKEIVALRSKIRREATELITDLILNNKDDFSEDVKDAAVCLLPKNRSEAKSRLPAKAQEIYDLFVELNAVITEDILFTDFKYGRFEMKGFIKDIIKKSEPHERKWIEFDPATGYYYMVKIGSEPPLNWTGYMPPYKQIT